MRGDLRTWQDRLLLSAIDWIWPKFRTLGSRLDSIQLAAARIASTTTPSLGYNAPLPIGERGPSSPFSQQLRTSLRFAATL